MWGEQIIDAPLSELSAIAEKNATLIAAGLPLLGGLGDSEAAGNSSPVVPLREVRWRARTQAVALKLVPTARWSRR
jgi:hypothetical protein